MARVAEVGRAEAEVDGHGAAVATLVLEEVGSVFGAHLEKRGTCMPDCQFGFWLGFFLLASHGLIPSCENATAILNTEASYCE